MCMQLRCHRIAQRHVEPGGLGCLEPSSNEEQGIGMYVRSTGYTTFEIHYTIPTGIRGIKVKGRFPRCSVPSPLQTKLGRLGGLAQPKKYCTYIGAAVVGTTFRFGKSHQAVPPRSCLRCSCLRVFPCIGHDLFCFSYFLIAHHILGLHPLSKNGWSHIQLNFFHMYVPLGKP